jgi:methionine-rich copper-binding protein CopC
MPARAHAYLVDSNRIKNQEAMHPLEKIELVFSGKVDALFSTAELSDESGAATTRVTREQAGREMTFPAPAPLLGRYRVHYRILSVDGGVVEGTLAFTVGRVAAGIAP